MPRPTYRDQFLNALEQMSSKGSKLVANSSLREALKWPMDRYEAIKNELLGARQVIIARGSPGGLIGLANSPDAKSLSLFISYSHVDKELRDILAKHLEPLKTRLNLISTWHDGMLKAGDEWDKEIMSQIDHADIVLLLVSVDFVNSNYCYQTEMERAIELHGKKKIRVIPIVARTCSWEFTPFAKLQSLLHDKPLASWSDRDEACLHVAKEIRKIAEEIRAQ